MQSSKIKCIIRRILTKFKVILCPFQLRFRFFAKGQLLINDFNAETLDVSTVNFVQF